MVTLAMWVAVLRIVCVWRERTVPYLRRYGYNHSWSTRFAGLRQYDEMTFKGAHHRKRNVRRSIRHQIGNVQVVKAARSVGYAARMSHIALHTEEVYA